MAKRLTNEVLNKLILEAISEVQQYFPSAEDRQTGLPVQYSKKARTPITNFEDSAEQFLKLLYQRKELPAVYKKQIDQFFDGQLGGVGTPSSRTKSISITGQDLSSLLSAEPEKKSWLSRFGSKVKSIFKEEYNGNIPDELLEKLILEVLEEADGVLGFSPGVSSDGVRTPSQLSRLTARKLQQEPMLTASGLLQRFLDDPKFPEKIKSEISDFLPSYAERVAAIAAAKAAASEREKQDEIPTGKMPTRPTSQYGDLPRDLPQPEKITSRAPTAKGTGTPTPYLPASNITDIPPTPEKLELPADYGMPELPPARQRLARPFLSRVPPKQQRKVSEQKIIDSLIAEVLEEMAKKGKKEPKKETKPQPKKTGKK